MMPQFVPSQLATPLAGAGHAEQLVPHVAGLEFDAHIEPQQVVAALADEAASRVGARGVLAGRAGARRRARAAVIGIIGEVGAR